MHQKAFIYLFFVLGVSWFGFTQKKTSTISAKLETIKIQFENQDYSTITSEAKKSPKSLAKNTNDSLKLAETLHFQGNAFYETQDYFNAIIYFDKGIKTIPNNNEGLNLKGKLLLDKSYAEEDLQMENAAYKTTKEAENVFSNLKDCDLNYFLDTYIKLSSHAAYINFFDDAEFYLKKAEDLITKHEPWNKTSPDEASKKVLLLYKKIYLYHLSGEENKLINHLKVLENLKKQQQFNAIENLMLAASLNCVGDFYLNNKDKFEKNTALKKGGYYLDKALDIIDKNNYSNSYIQFLFNKAKQSRYSEKFKEALELNSKIIDLAGENDYRIPFFLGQRTMIFIDMNDKKNALDTYKKMVVNIHSDSIKLKRDYSNFKPSTNINHSGLLLDIADELNSKFSNDSVMLKQTANYYTLGLKQLQNSYQQEVYSDRIKTYYDRAIKGILKSKTLGYNNLNFKQILNNIENIENKLAWKAFLKNRNLTKLSLPDSIFESEKYIRNQLVNARNNNDSLQIITLNKFLEKRKNQLEKTFPSISKYAYSEFNIENLQHKLDEETLIIKYKKIDSLLFVFGISKNNIAFKTITFSNNEINKIKNYINLLKNKKSDKVLAQNIFKILIPFDIKNYKKLTFLQDDILHHLPFETLVNNNQYLVTNFNINYASYLAFVNYDGDSKLKNTFDNLYVFSPTYLKNDISNERNASQQLLGANNESTAISKLFRSTHFKNNQATKHNFINYSNQAHVLHLAMHANIDNEKPELSYFEFYGDSVNSKLYLEELYALKLKANLAVLSACNTGSDLSKNHLGNVSLQRAFTLAGVPATVSSLWNVPDTATEFIMTRFYENLKKGFSKSEALQLAKKQYLNSHTDANMSAPYFWAGFIISGDTSPIMAETNVNLYVWYILGIIAFGIVLFMLFQNFKKR